MSSSPTLSSIHWCYYYLLLLSCGRTCQTGEVRCGSCNAVLRLAAQHGALAVSGSATASVACRLSIVGRACGVARPDPFVLYEPARPWIRRSARGRDRDCGSPVAGRQNAALARLLPRSNSPTICIHAVALLHVHRLDQHSGRKTITLLTPLHYLAASYSTFIPFYSIPLKSLLCIFYIVHYIDKTSHFIFEDCLLFVNPHLAYKNLQTIVRSFLFLLFIYSINFKLIQYYA